MSSKKHLLRLALIRLSPVALAVSFALIGPSSALAASNLEVSGWIPYWRTEAGTADARAHLDQFTGVNPFAYSVRADGTLADTANIGNSSWQRLIKDARAKKVRVIPSIMWSDSAAMHTILTDPAKRKAHIRSIVAEVERNNFDGIDIDYEGKRAATRDGYSAFLKELSAELKSGSKARWLECTIEVRMPLEARYSGTPPAGIEYSNDLPKINQYCDRVRVMTYDQQTADVQLNRQHAGKLYAPVSDTAWVEKTLKHMTSDISKSKMVMGIPTYGYVWQAMPKPDGSGYTYIKIESFNPAYGHNVAKEYGLTPARGASGELTLSFVPKDNPLTLPTQDELARRAPKGTASAYLAAAGALALAKEKRQQAPLTYLTWSDAGSIKQKVDLATKLGINGVAIFKIDGGTDPGLWNALPASAPKLLAAPKGTGKPSTSTPATKFRFTKNLEFGDNNNDVLELQKVLAAKGYLKATPNGNFGPMTRDALKSWQRANKLTATGYFGSSSRSKMNAR